MVQPRTRASSPYMKGPYGAPDPGDLVRLYSFATIISPQLHVTATPISFEDDDSEATLIGHMNRANPHATALTAGDPVVAICAGPHAYVSPRWYVDKPTVPTWNYVMAVVRGTIEPIDDDIGQLAVLRKSVDQMESAWNDPWTIDDAPDGRVEQLLPRTRSFRIHVESIEGVTKLSQTHPASDRERIIAGLLALPAEPSIASLMRNLDADS